jgi:hypothetical protein
VKTDRSAAPVTPVQETIGVCIFGLFPVSNKEHIQATMHIDAELDQGRLNSVLSPGATLKTSPSCIPGAGDTKMKLRKSAKTPALWYHARKRQLTIVLQKDGLVRSYRVTEYIYTKALELLERHPEGLRFSELRSRIEALDPGLHPKTVNGCVWKLPQKFPDKVYKPSRGLFRLLKYKSSESSAL